MFWSRRAWLWTHLAGGALTIALGPLQFLSRWPRPCARLQRAFAKRNLEPFVDHTFVRGMHVDDHQALRVLRQHVGAAQLRQRAAERPLPAGVGVVDAIGSPRRAFSAEVAA